MCQELLRGVSAAVDAALAMLKNFRSRLLQQRSEHLSPLRLSVLGCSMGGYAALEYCRFRPRHVSSAAIIAGYYDPREQDNLVEVTGHIPFLVVHFRGDTVCPIKPIEHLIERRKRSAHAVTQSRVLPGSGHCPEEAERQKALDWLLEHSR